MVPAQGLAVVLAAVPGLVEVLGNRPPALVPSAEKTITGFCAIRGAAVPPAAAEQVDVRQPLAVEAAFACRLPAGLKLSASVDWGDGSHGPATVEPDKRTPAWLLLPPAVASIAAPSAVSGKLVAAHPYASAELYTVRITLQVARADGAVSSFSRTHRLRVRDPSAAHQPWRFDLEAIMVNCGEQQACDFPAPLGTRINAEAVFKFGPSWLASHSARWDWGDGKSEDVPATSRGGVGRAAASHVYTKGGRFKLRLALTGRHKDGTPDAKTQTFDVVVADMAIDELAGPPGPVAGGYPVDLQATFRYSDPKRTRRAKWEWGDGVTSDGELSERSGMGTAFGQHTYKKAGVYKAKLVLADGEGQATAAVEVTVTSPGSVTATGSIPCPAGVLIGNPDASGQAQMTLSARHDGAAASGTFRLAGPGFEFQSEHLESLAISPKEARVSGLGALNGRRPYSFTLDVWSASRAEGQPEQPLARLRIFDAATRRPVFDNDVFDGALQPMVGAKLSFVVE